MVAVRIQQGMADPAIAAKSYNLQVLYSIIDLLLTTCKDIARLTYHLDHHTPHNYSRSYTNLLCRSIMPCTYQGP